MGYLSGNTGKILFARGDSVVDPNIGVDESGWQTLPTRIQNWTLNTTANLLDVTSLGDYDKKTIYGVRTTSGTMRLFYYTEEAESSPRNNAASWFFNALCRADLNSAEDWLPHYVPDDPYRKESIEVRLRLFLQETSSTVRDYMDLEANLTSVSIGSAVNEVVAVDVAFEATVASRPSAEKTRDPWALPVRRVNL